MTYGEFRTGDNKPDPEGRDIAKIRVLRSIDQKLDALCDILKQIAHAIATR